MVLATRELDGWSKRAEAEGTWSRASRRGWLIATEDFQDFFDAGLGTTTAPAAAGFLASRGLVT